MAALPASTSAPRSRPRYVAPVLPRVAALYPRVSTKHQDGEDKTSLKTQENGCCAQALADGRSVPEQHIYRERHTGEEWYERPELTRLLAAARRGEFDAVYVHSIERLSRNPIHLGIILEELERAGVEVHFVTERLDESPEAGVVRYIKGYAGQIENERRRERSLRAKRARAERGYPIPGHKPPYGYRWADIRDKDGKLVRERLEADPATWPVMQRIWREAASGATLRGLAGRLTAEGVPTPMGHSAVWYPEVIRGMLRNPLYWGQAQALRSVAVPVDKSVRERYASKSRTMPREPAGQVPPGAGVAPAVVTIAEAEQVHARLRLNQRMATRNNHDPEETLLRGGFARCAYCGTGMTVSHSRSRDGTRHPQYRCDRSMRTKGACTHHGVMAHRLDEAVWTALHRILCDPALVAREVEQLRNAPEDQTAADALAVIDHQLADLSRRIKNKHDYVELVDDPRERAEVAAEVTALRRQQDALEAERVAALRRHAASREQQAGLERVLDWCERVGANLDAMTYDERRATLHALRAEVLLYRTDRADGPRAELTIHLPLAGDIPLDCDLQTLVSRHSTRNCSWAR